VVNEFGQGINVGARAAGSKRKRNGAAGRKGKEAAGGKGKEAVVISSGNSSDSEEDQANDKRLKHSRAASAQESVRVIERLQKRVADAEQQLAVARQKASDARDKAIAAYGDAAKAHGRCSEEMDKTRRLQLSLNDAQRELARKKLDYDNECMRAAADYEKFAAEREQWEKREGELEQELHERSDTVQSLCIQAQTQNLDACKNLIQVQSSELQVLRPENYNLNQRLRDAEQRLRDLEQRLRDAETPSPHAPSPHDSADESAGAANQYHNTRVGDDTWDISRRASPGAFAAHQEAARDLVARDNVVHISDNEDPLVEMCEAWNGKRRQDSDSDQQGRNVFPRTAEFLQNAFGSNGAASRDPPVSVNPSFGEGAVPAVAVPAAPGPADGYARDALGRIVIEDGAERC
jgi:hypothetical protein